MRVINNAIIYSAVTVLKNGIGFFLLPLYTAFLTPADYGIVGIITSMTRFLSVIMLLAMHGAGTRFHYTIAKNGGKLELLWGTVYAFVLLNGLFVTVLLAATHRYVVEPFFDNIPFYPYLLLGILISFFQAGYQIYHSYLRTTQDGRRVGILDFSIFVVKLTLTVGLVVIFDMKAVGVILALAVTQFAFFVIGFFNLKPMAAILPASVHAPDFPSRRKPSIPKSPSVRMAISSRLLR